MHVAFPEKLQVVELSACGFPGFSDAAFEILARLRAHPTSTQYRLEKAAIQAEIQAPFRLYRDELVLRWVLPNQLPLETERNVFSRLLKNDFGAGGCHHHLWLAFYRQGSRRLHDIQLAHTLRPEGLTVSLFVGAYMDQARRALHTVLANAAPEFLTLSNPLLENFHMTVWAKNGEKHVYRAPLAEVPEAWEKGKSYYWEVLIPKEVVLARKGAVVEDALVHVECLWPLYRYLIASTPLIRSPQSGSQHS